MTKFPRLLSVAVTAAFLTAATASQGTTVDYGGSHEGHLELPDGAGPHPAVILIHEWWGLNDDIRDKARQFADAGYVALAVDLYDGELATVPDKARELAGSVRGNPDGAFDNLRHAFSFLRDRADTEADRIASVGWCFGGGWSYQIAKNDLGAKASVIYYGFFNPADDLSQMRARIIGHFAENDRAIKVDDVIQFQASLKTASGEHEIYIYPNAGHGFANPDNPVFDMEASELAWDRTIAFLQRHL